MGVVKLITRACLLLGHNRKQLLVLPRLLLAHTQQDNAVARELSQLWVESSVGVCCMGQSNLVMRYCKEYSFRWLIYTLISFLDDICVCSADSKNVSSSSTSHHFGATGHLRSKTHPIKQSENNSSDKAIYIYHVMEFWIYIGHKSRKVRSCSE